MASNFPGPYQLRMYYDVAPGAFANVTHRMTMNIDVTNSPSPGTPFSGIDVSRRVGIDVALDTVASELQGVTRPLMSTADALITYAELWKYTPGTFDAQYISTYDISLAGLSGSAGRVTGVQIYTWRTAEGGIMQIYLMETVDTGNDQVAYNNLGADDTNFMDFFYEDATSYALGRDTSHPLVPLRMSASRHEALFKQRFR